MKLSVAYNKKSLIDENWVINKLKQEWRVVNGYFWSADTKLYGKTVWVSLTFGYMEESRRPEYYSSFGVVDGTTMDSKFITQTYYCWGDRYPGSWDVIRFYRDMIRKLLFPHGLRNQKQFYPNK